MTDALDILLRDMGRLDASVAVGAHDEETARKLAYAEFGTVHAPARPTLSAVTDRAERTIGDALTRKVAAIFDGHSRLGVGIVRGVGDDLAELVREEIDNNAPPPLAPSTVASRRRRGKDDRTLVDTGAMMRGIMAESREGSARWSDRDQE